MKAFIFIFVSPNTDQELKSVQFTFSANAHGSVLCNLFAVDFMTENWCDFVHY